MRVPRIFTSAVLLVFGIIVGCQKKPLTLEFIVPTGFSGVIKLRAHSTGGVELSATNGSIALVFPVSGTLDVKGTLPTLEWHTPVAKFADGTSIPILGPAATVPDDAVALRGLGIKDNNKESWYLVGRADQIQDALNKFYGFEVPKR